jgi:hypothetical protein
MTPRIVGPLPRAVTHPVAGAAILRPITKDERALETKTLASLI